MHILISYEDGTHEEVPVLLEGDVVASGPAWLPGHLPADPARCRFGADFFAAAMDEGGERSGSLSHEAADIDPDSGATSWQAFRWELVGSEEDECRAKLRQWASVFGEALDPDVKGADYPDEVTSQRLSPRQEADYDRDMRCCSFYLADPAAEADVVKQAMGMSPLTYPSRMP